MVELRHFGVAVPSEDVEDVALLLGCEEASAQLVTGVGAVAAEIVLHVSAERGDVGRTHGSEEAAEAPGSVDDAQLLEHRAAVALASRGEDGGTKLGASGHRLARSMPHATGGQRTGEEAKDVAFGHVFETELYVVVCHYSFFSLFHGFDHRLDKQHFIFVQISDTA